MDSPSSPLNILIVEDNETLRESLVDALGSVGHHACGVDCAEAVPETSDLGQIDIAILDLNLPGEDGLSLAGRLRVTHPDLGIIMLTARVNSADKAAGYAGGADMYLTKPASLAELQLAIRALARRLKPVKAARQPTALRLDPLHRALHTPDGHAISLTAHEAALLVAFARAAQHTLETWQIAEILGMNVAQLNKPALELHIVRLRKKLLQPQSQGSPIQAVRGRGYQLCVQLQVA